MGRSPVEQSGPLRPEGCTLQSDAGRASTVVRLRKLFEAVLVIRCGMARDYSPLPWIVLVSLLIFAIWAVVVHFLGLG